MCDSKIVVYLEEMWELKANFWRVQTGDGSIFCDFKTEQEARDCITDLKFEFELVEVA